MEQETRKKIIYIAVALIVLVGLGILFSYLAGNKLKVTENLVISGTVQQKTDTSITVDALSLRGVKGNPADQKILRTVNITEKTGVKKQTQKDAKTIQDEQDAFAQLLKNGDTKTKPPVPFVEEKASISDIVVGSYVTIQANKDVEKNDTFTAKSILINPPETIPNIPTAGAPEKIGGVIGWIGAANESKFAVDRGDGKRVQVLINPGARIMRQVAKSDKEFQSELELYRKGTMVVAPLPVKDEMITFADLHLGDQVDVQGIGDEVNGMLADSVTVVFIKNTPAK